MRRKSHTRGGLKKRIFFEWWIDSDQNALVIHTEKGRQDKFSIEEIIEILTRIRTEFADGYFPLANNVEKLGEGTENRGLGTMILELKPGDITHAQAASYLGPVLEDSGYFIWNGKNKGIMWKLCERGVDKDALMQQLEDALR